MEDQIRYDCYHRRVNVRAFAVENTIAGIANEIIALFELFIIATRPQRYLRTLSITLKRMP